MIARILSAGDIIEARCTKCRAVLNHRIVAMVGSKVVRVECNTCGGVHNYYPPGEAKKTPPVSVSARAKGAATGKTRSVAGTKDREEWEALVPAMNSGKAVPYDINGKYQVNDIIEHPVFGLGVVKIVVKPNKMEVVFQEGKKLLRCAV
jgi:hypothetical protein